MKPDLDRHYQFLKTRSLVVQAIRDFFCSQGYLEVDTPLLCPTIIPEAQIDPVSVDGYFLQASPEMCMKRLLSNGFDRIFQICKSFRKNERGSRHLPEFTILEWYTKNNTYIDLMRQCFELINFIAAELKIGDTISYQGKSINISTPWLKITVAEAFKKYSNKDLQTALIHDTFDEIISFEIEPNLGNSNPAFLCDYPAQLASLAKLLPENPDVAQRFELYIAGLELANGFTELNDSKEQRIRFEKENQIRISQNTLPLPMPENFLNDLENMPDAAGIALGVDRLTMIFCDVSSIEDVIPLSPEIL